MSIMIKRFINGSISNEFINLDNVLGIRFIFSADLDRYDWIDVSEQDGKLHVLGSHMISMEPQSGNAIDISNLIK